MAKFEIDEGTDELLVWEEPLFGKRRIDKRIPLSKIEAVRFSHTVESVGMGGRQNLYRCALLIDGHWEVTIGHWPWSRGRMRSLAAMVGLHLENREKKLQEIADHLSHLFGVTVTVADEASRTPQEYRRLARQIVLRCVTPYTGKTSGIRKLRVEGIIRLQSHVIDSVEVLNSDVLNSYYVLGYTISGKTVDVVRTHRSKKNLFGGRRQFERRLTKVEWKGGPLTDQLNSDLELRQLLVQHLGRPDCDAYITTDELSGNTMIIFGDSYPQQWIKLPRKLFPTEERIRIVTLLGQKIRSL